MRETPLGELDYRSLAQSIIIQALRDAFTEPYPYNYQALDWLTGRSHYAWFEFWCEHAGLHPSTVSKRIELLHSSPELSNHVTDILKENINLNKLFDKR